MKLRDKMDVLRTEQSKLVELDQAFDTNTKTLEKEVQEAVDSLIPQYLGSAHILNMIHSGCKSNNWIPEIYICSVQDHIKLDNNKWVKEDCTKFNIVSQKVLYESDFKGMQMVDLECNLYEFMWKVNLNTGLACRIQEIQYCEGKRPLMGVCNAYQLECTEDVIAIDKDSIEYKGSELSDDYYLTKNNEGHLEIYVGNCFGIDYKVQAFDYHGLEDFLKNLDDEPAKILRNNIKNSWDNKL